VTSNGGESGHSKPRSGHTSVASLANRAALVMNRRSPSPAEGYLQAPENAMPASTLPVPAHTERSDLTTSAVLLGIAPTARRAAAMRAGAKPGGGHRV
jgi:hypothetical protein